MERLRIVHSRGRGIAALVDRKETGFHEDRTVNGMLSPGDRF